MMSMRKRCSCLHHSSYLCACAVAAAASSERASRRRVTLGTYASYQHCRDMETWCDECSAGVCNSTGKKEEKRGRKTYFASSECSMASRSRGQSRASSAKSSCRKSVCSRDTSLLSRTSGVDVKELVFVCCCCSNKARRSTIRERSTPEAAASASASASEPVNPRESRLMRSRRSSSTEASTSNSAH